MNVNISNTSKTVLKKAKQKTKGDLLTKVGRLPQRGKDFSKNE